MKQLAVGLMSGTSADGVSAVIVSFDKNSFKLINYKTYPYSAPVRKKIFNAPQLTASEISELNFQLGNIFAKDVLNLLKESKVNPNRILVIGSHGQTISHNPRRKVPNTFQICESSIIAEKTGITVVADFRAGNIAAGGEGAPLVPFFDCYFFGNGPARALQNIGGIANVTAVGKNVKEPIAFDTGPGNCLIDWAVRQITKGKSSFDKNGMLARKGDIMIDAVHQMIKHPYFKRQPPKSTGRELFNENFIPSFLKSRLRKYPLDVLSTLTYFTALTIAQSYKKFIFPKYKIEEIVVSGGGALNQTLMFHLKNLLFPIPICAIEKYDVPVQAKESIAFAFFALRAVQGQANQLPITTGAKKNVILGKITPGKNFKGLK